MVTKKIKKTENDLKLGKRIKKLRNDKEWTQAELSEKLGVSEKHIQFIESATRKPSLKLLNKIAKTLGVKVGELFDF